MTLGQWWQILALYEFILVWPLALFVLFKLLRARTRTGRAVGIGTLVLLFTPFVHRWVGDIYFDYLCEHEAGEFIYRTVENVEGILQMRPRDGSKDYFDRMAKGDLPEDPWGHTNLEAQAPWYLLNSYTFFETDASVLPSIYRHDWYHASLFWRPANGERYARFSGYDGRELTSTRKEFAFEPRSRFGYTWKETTSVTQSFLNIRGGELAAIDHVSQEVLGRKRGFFRLKYGSSCPWPKTDDQVERFVVKVLRPTNHGDAEQR